MSPIHAVFFWGGDGGHSCFFCSTFYICCTSPMKLKMPKQNTQNIWETEQVRKMRPQQVKVMQKVLARL